MSKKTLKLIPDEISSLIAEVRGQKVILDGTLALIYGTATKFLNRAVKRNCKRFPPDFVFQLTRQEAAHLRYQFGTSKPMRSAQPHARADRPVGPILARA